jgi:hypothetical protein
MNPTHADDEREFDPSVVRVLEQLWIAFTERRDKPSSVARLSKQARLPMSTLRRTLTDLKSAGLVDFSIDEDGRGFAALTGQGAELCSALSSVQR